MVAKNQVHRQISSTISSALNNSSATLNKRRRDFIFNTLILFLSIPGRVCFLQLGRYSKRGEQSFRQQFERCFNFMEFNSHIVKENFSTRKAIAIDPSYISKSGKKTPYFGIFWSGCSQAIKRGLEIMGIAAIDIQTNRALHLEAIQTPPTKTLSIMFKSLIDWYLYLLQKKCTELLEISNIVVADAYFAKQAFVEGLQKMGFHLVSRLQRNANLQYIYTGQHTAKRGRPRKYDGKIDVENIDLSKFEQFNYKNYTCYYAIVYSVAFKRNILLIVEQNANAQRMIFSTDLLADPTEVLETYHARFLIEFQFRDAKQATGLTHCQARSINKLHSHFNFALTAVNLAKIAHWKADPTDKQPFSIANIKLLMHNKIMIDTFIRKFGINPNLKKNHKIVKELMLHGIKAA